MDRLSLSTAPIRNRLQVYLSWTKQDPCHIQLLRSKYPLHTVVLIKSNSATDHQTLVCSFSSSLPSSHPLLLPPCLPNPLVLSLLYRPRIRRDTFLDRGSGFYEQERKRLGLTALVDTGRHAGRSRIIYVGKNLAFHLLLRDYFISLVNLSFTKLLSIIATTYLIFYLFWSCIYMLLIHFYPSCISPPADPPEQYAEAFTFAVITAQTIGYGNNNPGNCQTAAWLVALQSFLSLILNAIVIGLVFARISHPKYRGRSIYISDCAVIARRDGILKLMFRLADVRSTQVTEARLKAFLYTWGEGRVTAEEEHITVRCEELDISQLDGQVLLPITVEHTIDERSPLCGHTFNSLKELDAEIIVTFEGTSEMGNPFMARQSYLATEIHWGHVFVPFIKTPITKYSLTSPQPPPPTTSISGANNIDINPSSQSISLSSPEFLHQLLHHDDGLYYAVDLNYFHTVQRQPGLPNLPPPEMSELVVNRAKRTVPYPMLGENTLVLSDAMCLNGDSMQEEEEEEESNSGSTNNGGTSSNDNNNKTNNNKDKKSKSTRFKQLRLTCRLADTYPGNFMEITVKMFLFRWPRPPSIIHSQHTHTQQQQHHPQHHHQHHQRGDVHVHQCQLECGYSSGEDRAELRFPTEIVHVINDSSPLSNWLTSPDGIMEDKDSEILVVVNGYLNLTTENRMRQRTYRIDQHVKWYHGFKPTVRQSTADNLPRVLWSHFHATVPLQNAPVSALTEYQMQHRLEAAAAAAGTAGGGAGRMSHLGEGAVAPESHAYLRSVEVMGKRTEIDPGTYPGGGGGGDGDADGEYPMEWNDYTIVGGNIDLERYAAQVGGADSPRAPGGRRSLRPRLSVAFGSWREKKAAATGGKKKKKNKGNSSLEDIPVDGVFVEDDDNQHQENKEEEEQVAKLTKQKKEEQRKIVLQRYAQQTMDAESSLPHQAALHPTLPVVDNFRMLSGRRRDAGDIVGDERVDKEKEEEEGGGGGAIEGGGIGWRGSRALSSVIQVFKERGGDEEEQGRRASSSG